MRLERLIRQPLRAPGGIVRCCFVLGSMLAAAALSPSRADLLDQFAAPSIPGTQNETGVTVTSRTHPEFDTQGVRAGAFTIRPMLLESLGYDSNVLGTTVPHGSPVIETNAGIDVASDWGRNSVQAALSVDNVEYTRQSKQSFTNWTASLGGTYEIGRDVIAVSYTHLNLTQRVTDLDVATLDQALAYRIDAARVQYRANFARIFVTPAVDVSYYSFDNGVAQGTSYVQDYRDRLVITPGVTLGYELSPQRNLVLVIRDSVADYSRPPPGLPRENFNELGALTGIDYQASGPLRFRALVGYEVRKYHAANYKTIQAPVAEGSVIWATSGLTTVSGTVSRRIQDSASDLTVGYTENSVLLRVDHEYLRNVLLRASVGFYSDQYNGSGSQTLITTGAGTTYRLNRNAQLDLSYLFSARQSGSNLPTASNGQEFGSSYTDHRILMRFRVAL